MYNIVIMYIASVHPDYTQCLDDKLHPKCTIDIIVGIGNIK